jgi:hypothetical protein
MLGAGISLAFVAILNRQSCIIIIPALILAYFLKDGVIARTIWNAVLTGLSALVVYLLYPEWLKLSGRMPIMYNMQLDQLLTSYSRGLFDIAATYARNVVIIAVYIGLFVLPFLIVVLSIQYKSLCCWQKRRVILPTTLAVVGVAVLFATKKSMPLTGNILNFFDVGGQSLWGYQLFLGPRSLKTIRLGWECLTVIGAVGAGSIVICIVLGALYFNTDFAPGRPALCMRNTKGWLVIFVTCLILGYVLGVAGLEKLYWFDRYLIILVPLAMMVASMSTIKLRATKVGVGPTCGAAVLLLFYGGVTIAGTHDHLASNRVLWRAVSNAMENGKLQPNQINGGFEFNGWYFGNELRTCNPEYSNKAQPTRVGPIDFTCLFENEQWEYVASYVPEEEFTIEAQYSFRRWLPWKEQSLFILHKVPRE